MDTSHKNILRKGRKMEDVWCCRQATTCIAFLEQYFGCVKKKSVSLPDFFWGEGGVCTQASVRQMIGTIRGRPSLRSWRYSLGARLKFWRQSHDPNRGLRRQISLEYYTIPPDTYTQAKADHANPSALFVVNQAYLSPVGDTPGGTQWQFSGKYLFGRRFEI